MGVGAVRFALAVLELNGVLSVGRVPTDIVHLGNGMVSTAVGFVYAKVMSNEGALCSLLSMIWMSCLYKSNMLSLATLQIAFLYPSSRADKITRESDGGILTNCAWFSRLFSLNAD